MLDRLFEIDTSAMKTAVDCYAQLQLIILKIDRCVFCEFYRIVTFFQLEKKVTIDYSKLE